MLNKAQAVTKLFAIAFIAVLVLAGCGDAAPTATVVPQAAPTATTASAGDPTATAATTGSASASCSKLNLNTLTGDQLMAAIPGFSQRMVREFQEYRPYSSIQQFRREIGKYVDTAQVAEWEKYVYVPIDPNSADADTLQQIPGVDATIAAALISGRSYASSDAFLQALASQISADQLAQASCFLVQ